jgi:hypothetical protein
LTPSRGLGGTVALRMRGEYRSIRLDAFVYLLGQVAAWQINRAVISVHPDSCRFKFWGVISVP